VAVNMRRRTLLVVLAGLAVVVAVGVVALWPQAVDRVTKESYDRIHAGMTRTEVEAILGPPGDYSSGPTSGGIDYGGILEARMRGSDAGSWNGDTGEILLTFDERRVTTMHFGPNEVRRLRPFDTVLWRLKRLWHRWFPE
jgi:hypothetical protein